MQQPKELLQRVEDNFHLATNANDVLFLKPSMLKLWPIQRIHFLRGSLSNLEVEEGILYRYVGTLQLNYTKSERTAVPVWILVRCMSQQQGFHFHQIIPSVDNRQQGVQCAFPGPGYDWSGALELQRLVDLKQPGVDLVHTWTTVSDHSASNPTVSDL